MPLRSVAPAILPSDAESPRTTVSVVDHGPRRETQTGTRTSVSEPRRGQSRRGHPHGSAGNSSRESQPDGFFGNDNPVPWLSVTLLIRADELCIGQYVALQCSLDLRFRCAS